MRPPLALFALTVALTCCARAQDTPRSFSGFCQVEAAGRSWTTNCRSEDMGAAGYNNRFHIILDSAPADISAPRAAMYVRCESLPSGNMRIASPLWGSITMLPFSPAIRAAMIKSAGDFEVRPQNLAVNPLPNGAFEVIIDEPQTDFNGRIPSQEWIARHVSDFARLSHAK